MGQEEETQRCKVALKLLVLEVPYFSRRHPMKAFVYGDLPFTTAQKVKLFWSKVQVKGPKECWPWQSGLDQKGYGVFWTGERGMHAHRFLLCLQIGRILLPDEHALHTCDYRCCCNPSHLFVGSNIDNIEDKKRKGRHRGWKHPNSPRGENHPRAKLTARQVISIRKQLAAGKTLTALAQKYGLTVQNIWHIHHGKTWKRLS